MSLHHMGLFDVYVSRMPAVSCVRISKFLMTKSKKKYFRKKTIRPTQ